MVRFQEIKKKRDKMSHYSKIVKEMHLPSVSPKKQKELEMLIKAVEKGNKPVKISIENIKSTRDEKGNEYMSMRYSRQRSMKESKYPASEADLNEVNESYRQKHTHVNWKKFNNPLAPKPKQK